MVKEILSIVITNETLPPNFQLQDYSGRPIASYFDTEEISKRVYPNDYLIGKIIRGKGNQIFVKWLEFDNSHNSWMNKTDINL